MPTGNGSVKAELNRRQRHQIQINRPQFIIRHMAVGCPGHEGVADNAAVFLLVADEIDKA
jgi:hypothetical protein